LVVGGRNVDGIKGMGNFGVGFAGTMLGGITGLFVIIG